MSIKVVIGANFGDEGKGLMTDYFASKTNGGIVVRFNGGAQAGHTVVCPDGTRHVFGHFGSGTLCDISTYLSEYFVVNPILFCKELESLRAKVREIPKIYVEEECLVTTPYDMILNQLIEEQRDDRRHGSCGVGFGETIERTINFSTIDIRWFKIRLRYLDDIRDYLKFIRDEWVRMRLKSIGIYDIPEKYKKIIEDDDLIERYIEDVKTMFEYITVVTRSANILDKFVDIVFEGAQGLLLDQDSKFFPHVTRSNTGLKNVMNILRSREIKNKIDVCYVTRAYMTRHGNGPFPTEVEGKPYENIVDLTNIPNKFQGKLRFGILDADLLFNSISRDLSFAKEYNINVGLAVTCLDQIDSTARVVYNGSTIDINKHKLVDLLMDGLNVKHGYISKGPTRESVTTYNC